MRQEIEIGLLYSTTGTYRRIGQASLAGARAAIADVNADPARPFSFRAVEGDPGGAIDAYPALSAQMLAETSVRHIVGCVTSWSRKEVIPVLERAGGTLWYGCPYEGFEASDHVVYAHACPNQHLFPLLNWALGRFGARGYLVGSNYIWGWEMSRIARALIADAGGATLGERYLPIGDTDVDRMVAELRAARPDFVLNSLIGQSSYAFLEAVQRLRAEDPYFAEGCPVLSCNFTECELDAVGPAAEGLISVGPYFAGEHWPGLPEGRHFASSLEAAPYAAVMMLADLLAAAPDRAAGIGRLLAAAPADGMIDPTTHHTRLPVLIAQVQKGAFRVIERLQPVDAAPYLSHWPEPVRRRPALRLVP